jgi:hypothetical protein
MIIIPTNKILLIPVHNHELLIVAVTYVPWFMCTFFVIFHEHVTLILPPSWLLHTTNKIWQS